ANPRRFYKTPSCPSKGAKKKPPGGGGGVLLDPPHPPRIIAPPISAATASQPSIHLVFTILLCLMPAPLPDPAASIFQLNDGGSIGSCSLERTKPPHRTYRTSHRSQTRSDHEGRIHSEKSPILRARDFALTDFHLPNIIVCTSILRRSKKLKSAPAEARTRMAPKYIFVTGGVVSSLGKGVAASSIGCLLESRGFKIT